MSYLDNINSPADVKKLNLKELEALAEEIRSAILNRDSKIGGHVGPNLGIVETTIALHYVFNSPEDKIVYDVSHQSYPHKILTGRKNGFLTDEGMRKISGYTTPAESEHDHFIVGHTSTSVSLACGLAKARDLKGEKHNVIAVIGDGSLSGGEALEGFDNAAVLNSNIIIIVNDNEMSIAENKKTTTKKTTSPLPKTTAACTATCGCCARPAEKPSATCLRLSGSITVIWKRATTLPN